MGLGPSKCKILLQDGIDSKPNLVLARELGGIDKFSYLGDCISPGGRASDEASSRI